MRGALGKRVCRDVTAILCKWGRGIRVPGSRNDIANIADVPFYFLRVLFRPVDLFEFLFQDKRKVPSEFDRTSQCFPFRRINNLSIARSCPALFISRVSRCHLRYEAPIIADNVDSYRAVRMIARFPATLVFRDVTFFRADRSR